MGVSLCKLSPSTIALSFFRIALTRPFTSLEPAEELARRFSCSTRGVRRIERGSCFPARTTERPSSLSSMTLLILASGVNSALFAVFWSVREAAFDGLERSSSLTATSALFRVPSCWYCFGRALVAFFMVQNLRRCLSCAAIIHQVITVSQGRPHAHSHTCTHTPINHVRRYAAEVRLPDRVLILLSEVLWGVLERKCGARIHRHAKETNKLKFPLRGPPSYDPKSQNDVAGFLFKVLYSVVNTISGHQAVEVAEPNQGDAKEITSVKRVKVSGTLCCAGERDEESACLLTRPYRERLLL